jgi:hypothetical protein
MYVNVHIGTQITAHDGHYNYNIKKCLKDYEGMSDENNIINLSISTCNARLSATLTCVAYFLLIPILQSQSASLKTSGSSTSSIPNSYHEHSPWILILGFIVLNLKVLSLDYRYNITNKSTMKTNEYEI